MEPPTSEPPADRHESARLRAAVARLEVHRYERLDYTEPPVVRKHRALFRVRRRLAALRRLLFRR